MSKNKNSKEFSEALVNIIKEIEDLRDKVREEENQEDTGNPLKTSLYDIAAQNPGKHWESILNSRGLAGCSVSEFKRVYEEGRHKGSCIRRREILGCLFNVSELGKIGNLELLCWTAKLFQSDEDKIKIYQHFAVWCAERVRRHMTANNSMYAIDVARGYLDGNLDNEKMRMAIFKARDVYRLKYVTTRDANNNASVHAAQSSYAAACASSYAYEAYHYAELASDAAVESVSDSFKSVGFGGEDSTDKGLLERSEHLKKLISALDKGVFEYD